MIGRVQGQLLEKYPPSLMLDVGGIGYELEVPLTTFFILPEPGQRCVLFTHLVTREEEQRLFGFITRQDRDVFRLLLRVNGVGPKVALALLSGMNASDLVRCVERADTARLTQLPGIGRKTAERIIVDMRDRLTNISEALTSEGMRSSDKPSAVDGVTLAVDPTSEAVAALVALGFKNTDARQRVNAVGVQGLDVEQLIRRALQGGIN